MAIKWIQYVAWQNCFKQYMKFGDKVFNDISLLSLTMLVLSLLSCQLG